MCDCCRKIDRTIDVSGRVCPYPVMEVRDALKEMEAGQVLEVVTDYQPAAKESIPNFCEKKGFSFEVSEREDGTFRLFITKTG